MTVFGYGIQEGSNTTGTAPFQFVGSTAFSTSDPANVATRRTWVSGVGGGNQGAYIAVNTDVPGEWEEGLGTVSSGSTDSLSRDYILASSNAGTIVTFSTGLKRVYNIAGPAYHLARHTILDPVGTTDLDYEQLFTRTNTTALPSGFAITNSTTNLEYREQYGTGTLYDPGSATHPNFRLVTRTASTDWSAVEIGFRGTADDVVTTHGLILRDSATGEFIVLGTDFLQPHAFFAQNYNSPTSYNSDIVASFTRHLQGSRLVFRVERNASTDLDFKIGVGGAALETIASAHDPTGFLAIDQLGWGVNARDGSTPAIMHVDYFRIWT